MVPVVQHDIFRHQKRATMGEESLEMRCAFHESDLLSQRDAPEAEQESASHFRKAPQFMKVNETVVELRSQSQRGLFLQTHDPEQYQYNAFR